LRAVHRVPGLNCPGTGLDREPRPQHRFGRDSGGRASSSNIGKHTCHGKHSDTTPPPPPPLRPPTAPHTTATARRTLRPLLGSTHTTQRDTVTHMRTTPARPLFLHGTSFVRQRRRVANCLSNHILHICNRRRRFSSLCLRGSVPRSWGECILLADAPSVSTARLCHCRHLQPQTQLPPSPLSGRYHTPKSLAVRLRKCRLVIPSTMSSPTHTSHVSRSSTARGENTKPVVSLQFCLLRPQMPPRRSVDSVQSDAHFSRFQVKHHRRRERETGCEFMAPLCPPNAASLQCRLPMPAQPPNHQGKSPAM
jgi:hypothetical protein